MIRPVRGECEHVLQTLLKLRDRSTQFAKGQNVEWSAKTRGQRLHRQRFACTGGAVEKKVAERRAIRFSVFGRDSHSPEPRFLCGRGVKIAELPNGNWGKPANNQLEDSPGPA